MYSVSSATHGRRRGTIQTFIKRIALVLGLCIVHYAVSFGLFMCWMKMKLALMDGDYRPLNTIETVVKGGAELLSQPLVPLLPTMAVWYSFAINSALWSVGLGVVAVAILAAWKRHREGQTG